jgi:hypothetical protein
MNTTTLEAPSEKQVRFINTLVAERVMTVALSERVENCNSKKSASTIIADLLAQPRKSGTGRAQVASIVANTAPTRVVPEGIYTVTDGMGGWITLKVDKASWAEGKTVIGVLNGTDNELSYKNFGFVTAQGIKKWGNAQVSERTIAGAQFLLTGSLDEAREQFLNLAEAHAISSGNCLACLRRLTVPVSVARGLGPICARRLGVA